MSIVGTYPANQTPKGYQQLAVSSTAVGLTVPSGASRAVCHVLTNAIRYRDDGTAPTASVGFPVAAATGFTLYGAASMAAFKAIRQSADAVLEILYYA